MTRQFLEYILSPEAVRASAERIVALTEAGDGRFSLHSDRLDHVSDVVIETMISRYPTLAIPYHSRWRHFESDRSALLKTYLDRVSGLSAIDRVRTGLDLVVPSVLLDAGAGPDWQYRDPRGETFKRSRGLALASLEMFLEGEFSVTKDKLRSDAGRLSELTSTELGRFFQIGADNPLIGVPGRTTLVNRLGLAIKSRSSVFPNARVGDLADYLLCTYGDKLRARDILWVVLLELGEIWPSRLSHEGIPLGDVWEHRRLGSGTESYVAFHKLSQWLTYSVADTLESNGFNVSGINELTGLAEYRNGGLFLDTGVLSLTDNSLVNQNHSAASDVIVEWRGLTIHLLDRVSELIGRKLELNERRLSLARILEGGTWFAGRKLALELRNGASPPLVLDSDGTVF